MSKILQIKKYQKPEIKKVKLIPEEAVLTLCKIVPNGSQVNKCTCSTAVQGYS